MQDSEDGVVLLCTCEQHIAERFSAREDMAHLYKHQWLQENGKVLASGTQISFSSVSHVHWYRAPTILAHAYVSKNFPCLF
jgi:hypothetical protein